MTFAEFLDGMVEINPEILMMETQPPDERTRKSFVWCLSQLGRPAGESPYPVPGPRIVGGGEGLLTNLQFGSALCSLGTLGTGESIDGMDRAIQDFFRKFDYIVAGRSDLAGRSDPAFLSWDIKLPFCIEIVPGIWSKFADNLNKGFRDMNNEPSGLD